MSLTLLFTESPKYDGHIVPIGLHITYIYVWQIQLQNDVKFHNISWAAFGCQMMLNSITNTGQPSAVKWCLDGPLLWDTSWNMVSIKFNNNSWVAFGCQMMLNSTTNPGQPSAAKGCLGDPLIWDTPCKKEVSKMGSFSEILQVLNATTNPGQPSATKWC